MKKNGFTLVELLVVAGITGFITTFIIINFNRNKVDLNSELNILISKIRLAQTKTVTSTRFNNSIRCGYGIRYIDNKSYRLYVGENASVLNCASQNKDYNPVANDLDRDISLEIVKFTDPRIEFKTIFRAIYFEPPDPKTFIIDNGGTVHNEPNYSLGITIGKVGGVCPNDCKTIYVFTSGKIE
jgi:prepilin-type N-terminal cleavage/methylation domain-containing protein